MVTKRSALTTAAALVAIVTGFACSPADDHSPASMTMAPPPAPPAPMTPPAGAMTFAIAKDLPPVAGNISRGAGHPDSIRTAYEFAARHPEVLSYIPCFCGCERMGHQGNDDCFVSQRDAKGKVREWETHGLVCEVCILVANDAMRMHNAGASLKTIRDAVVKRYGAGRPQTPTPMPPHRG